LPSKVIEYHGSDFAMLNVPKTVRLLFTIQVVVDGRFFGYEKNIMKSVCKWVKILYFLKLEPLIQQQLLQQLARVVAPDFDGTNRRHYIQFLYWELFKK
jgi:hypothetical protein